MSHPLNLVGLLRRTLFFFCVSFDPCWSPPGWTIWGSSGVVDAHQLMVQGGLQPTVEVPRTACQPTKSPESGFRPVVGWGLSCVAGGRLVEHQSPPDEQLADPLGLEEKMHPGAQEEVPPGRFFPPHHPLFFPSDPPPARLIARQGPLALTGRESLSKSNVRRRKQRLRRKMGKAGLLDGGCSSAHEGDLVFDHDHHTPESRVLDENDDCIPALFVPACASAKAPDRGAAALRRILVTTAVDGSDDHTPESHARDEDSTRDIPAPDDHAAPSPSRREDHFSPSPSRAAPGPLSSNINPFRDAFRSFLQAGSVVDGGMGSGAHDHDAVHDEIAHATEKMHDLAEAAFLWAVLAGTFRGRERYPGSFRARDAAGEIFARGAAACASQILWLEVAIGLNYKGDPLNLQNGLQSHALALWRATPNRQKRLTTPTPSSTLLDDAALWFMYTQGTTGAGASSSESAVELYNRAVARLYSSTTADSGPQLGCGVNSGPQRNFRRGPPRRGRWSLCAPPTNRG